MTLCNTLLLATLSACTLNAQDTLFFSDFEDGGTQFTLNTADLGGASGLTGANNWTVNDIYGGGTGSLMCLGSTFTFSIPPTAAQPSGISSANGQYAHIVSDAGVNSGVSCASFQAADGLCLNDESNFMAMNSDVSTLGQTGVSLSFWWLCGGGTTTYGELFHSLDGGNNWTNTATVFNNSNAWMQQSFLNSVFDDQSQIRFGWRFLNAVSFSAQDPGFGVDDILISSPCQSSMGSSSVSACDQYTSANGTTYTMSGTYTETYSNSAGCDSIVTLNVTINTADAGVVQSGITLSSTSPSGLYQWLDCTNGFMPVPGATMQSFMPSTNGSYALQITDDSCTDTSACFLVTTVGVNTLSLQSNISVWQEHSSNSIVIRIGNAPAETITLLSMQGAVVARTTVSLNGLTRLQQPDSPGVYIVSVQSGSTLQREAIVIE